MTLRYATPLTPNARVETVAAGQVIFEMKFPSHWFTKPLPAKKMEALLRPAHELG